MKRLLVATLMTAMAAAAQTPDALIRAGRYADAARAWGERLQSMPADAPERGDLENRQALYGSLADVPPQAIAFARGERTMHLEIGARSVDLHNVTLLASAPADNGNDGVLGMDALRDGFALDFTGAEDAGRLTIGGSR